VPPPPTLVSAAILAFGAASLGACGGGAPLLHPAHVLKPDDVTAGAGLSGQPVVLALPSRTDTGSNTTNPAAILQERTIAPSLAPWVNMRIGIVGSNEAGLTYTGRAARLDGRHAFKLSKRVSLSAGLGASAVLKGRQLPGEASGTSFAGGGFDIPLLLGWTSTAGLYSGWIGPRASVSWVKGDAFPLADLTASDFTAQQVSAGLVAGFRLGFRHVHVGLECSAAYHHVTGTFNNLEGTFNQITLSPAGALHVSF